MRRIKVSRAIGASTVAIFASVGAAQPHKLYVWTRTGTGAFHGQTVLDAGVGGGTGPASGPFTLIVKPDGQLQGAGSNGFGQFGHAPNFPSMPPAFVLERFVSSVDLAAFGGRP